MINWMAASVSIFICLNFRSTYDGVLDYFDEDGFIDDHIEFLVPYEEGMIVYLYFTFHLSCDSFNKKIYPYNP